MSGISVWRGSRWALCAFFILCAPVVGQPPKSSPQVARVEVKVAASVNGAAILAAEVQMELRRVVKGLKLTPVAQKQMEAQALQQLVDRVLILQNLDRTKQGATKDELDTALDRLSKQLKQTGKTLAAHAAGLGLDEPSVRRQYAWQIGWSRFLERYMTDENLSKFFEKQRRDFDGTQIRAAHILFKVRANEDGLALARVLEEAAKVRQEIVAGKITFEAAAAKYSAAPTKDTGGDVGFINRHDPMPESFSKAAFALEKGAVSEPVVSAFGVHLIHCREIMPGKKEWQAVRPEIEQAVAQYLFAWIADRERPNATIEFKAAVPHFKPGTQEVVE